MKRQHVTHLVARSGLKGSHFFEKVTAWLRRCPAKAKFGEKTLGRRHKMNLMPGRVGSDLGGLMSLPLVVVAIGIFEGAVFSAIRKLGLWHWFGIAIVLAIVGIALLAYARLPLYQQKRFLSVGPNSIPEDRKTAYKWAWLLVLVSILIQLLFLRMTR